MTTYSFKNSVTLPCPEPTLGELVGHPEFVRIDWSGNELNLSADATALEQSVVPWRFEVPVEVFEFSSEGDLIDPEICKFVVEGFSVPAIGVLVCRVQNMYEAFGNWRLALASGELLQFATSMTELEFDESHAVQDSTPVFLALQEVNEASGEWLAKKKATKAKLAAAVSEPPLSVDGLDLV